MPAASKSLTFRRRHRLSHALQFQAVYGARVRKARGPITVFALPNDRPEPRLGLSIGVRCGGAVIRNAIKRRLREAFRLSQHSLPRAAATPPTAYDYAVTAVKHDLLSVDEYAALLMFCADQLHREWTKRQRGATA